MKQDLQVLASAGKGKNAEIQWYLCLGGVSLLPLGLRCQGCGSEVPGCRIGPSRKTLGLKVGSLGAKTHELRDFSAPVRTNPGTLQQSSVHLQLHRRHFYPPYYLPTTTNVISISISSRYHSIQNSQTRQLGSKKASKKTKGLRGVRAAPVVQAAGQPLCHVLVLGTAAAKLRGDQTVVLHRRARLSWRSGFRT